jgi:hypothetical protein
MDQAIRAVRAERKVNVPVVLRREEMAKVIRLIEGVSHLVVKLLYGSGLRIMATLRLQVKDVDFKKKQVSKQVSGFGMAGFPACSSTVDRPNSRVEEDEYHGSTPACLAAVGTELPYGGNLRMADSDRVAVLLRRLTFIMRLKLAAN